MAVPFNQIRFQNANGAPQTWGFDAIRSYPRSDRHHIGLFPRDRGRNSYLSQTVKLVGMEDASPGENLEVLPTLVTSRSDERAFMPTGEMERGTLRRILPCSELLKESRDTAESAGVDRLMVCLGGFR